MAMLYNIVRGMLILTRYAEPFRALQYMKWDVSSTAICVILIKSGVQSITEARVSASTTVLFSLWKYQMHEYIKESGASRSV